MKNYVVLIAGTASVLAAITKLVFGLTLNWAWVVAPLWVPLAIAYVIFVGMFVHALGTGKLEIVPKPSAAALTGAPVFPFPGSPDKAPAAK